ncbi:MAG: FAD-dependent oxidoreductase, partial [Salinisphaera sp.]|nr:FAD-dependent oxidoreductase [Salinisphaera sp.]
FAFERGTLQDVDPAATRIALAPIESPVGHTLVPSRQVGYRTLVLALGGVTPDMGVDGVLEHAILLDRETDAEALSRRYSAKLLARAQDDDGEPMRVVIVGSGLTGVELAAHLASDAVCAALAPRAALPAISVTIVEAADTFMSGMDDEVRKAVGERLEALGVQINTGRQVSKVTADAVETEDGECFPADVTVWATGRVGPPVADDIDALATNEKRQWRVRPTLQSIDNDAVFALGDCACIDDDPAPPTAQAASEQAEHLAGQLPRYLGGARPEDFTFQDKGTLLSLGGGGSVGAVRGFFGGDLQVRGRLARTAYRGLQRQHEFLLLGAAKGSAEVLSNVFGRSMGPRLKVY